MKTSNDREDRADEADMFLFAHTSIWDQCAMEDLEDEWLFREGWPEGRATVHPQRKMRLCRGCNEKKPAAEFKTRCRIHRCPSCLSKAGMQ